MYFYGSIGSLERVKYILSIDLEFGSRYTSNIDQLCDTLSRMNVSGPLWFLQCLPWSSIFFLGLLSPLYDISRMHIFLII